MVPGKKTTHGALRSPLQMDNAIGTLENPINASSYTSGLWTTLSSRCARFLMRSW
jgi:hypothetical protein